MIKGIGTAFVTLLIVVFIIYLSYLCSKYIGRGFIGKRHSGYMKIVDQMAVGQDKSIAIVQTGVHYYLIGIAASGINVLAEVPEEDLIMLPEEEQSIKSGMQPDFKRIIEKFENYRDKKK